MVLLWGVLVSRGVPAWRDWGGCWVFSSVTFLCVFGNVEHGPHGVVGVLKKWGQNIRDPDFCAPCFFVMNGTPPCLGVDYLPPDFGSQEGTQEQTVVRPLKNGEPPGKGGGTLECTLLAGAQNKKRRVKGL